MQALLNGLLFVTIAGLFIFIGIMGALVREQLRGQMRSLDVNHLPQGVSDRARKKYTQKQNAIAASYIIQGILLLAFFIGLVAA